MSRFWTASFRLMYAFLALVDPLVRAVWRRFGLGNVVELRVARRNRPGVRSRLVGVLRADRRLYLGHPSGHVGWTRDLAAAGHGELVWPKEAPMAIVAEPVAESERETAILATSQHPFPGNLVYRLARPHIRAAGVFFRITPVDQEPRAPLASR